MEPMQKFRKPKQKCMDELNVNVNANENEVVEEEVVVWGDCVIIEEVEFAEKLTTE